MNKKTNLQISLIEINKTYFERHCFYYFEKLNRYYCGIKSCHYYKW